MPSLKNAKTLFISCWRSVKRECRGTFAIEFAFILPLMLILYVGAVEVSNTVTAWRRTDQVAYTVADLVAQARSLSASQIDNITAAASSILAPYSTDNLTIVLTSVVADKDNRPKVAWSCTNGHGSGRAKGSAVTLPVGLTEAGSSVIMAEVVYNYTPLVKTKSLFGLKFDNIPMSRTFYSRPRRSATVEKTDSGC